MPEEVVFLVETGRAVLIDDARAHSNPSLDDLAQWNAHRNASHKLQIAAAEAKEAAEKSKAHTLSEDALRKRKEREERRAAAARAKALAEGADIDLIDDISTPDAGPSQPPQTREQGRHSAPHTYASGTTATTASTSTPAYTITLPASSSLTPWYAPHDCTYSTLAEARAAEIWTYPADPHERAKCGVFRDLWEKGYFMGGGIRFGGDFLVYPGDPLRYHSHFVATVIDAPVSTIKPMEIVAHGRLGTATKKAHLLCGWDDERQEVSYFSIEWAGFG
ncbi:uncharacterized protein FIBRA_08273 [Fibroporia radiculosa]|uniref:tRNA-splicing endonuclease subunit Sen34 n=1 Tax=Fibroporia radiculosa TaxID=599839 RepID=J4GGZ8_9APHY|nr:uncharacterized protein FIBRA_08273 [Fibroporia radiculosa]CCM06028.1 predicted protein [Fibroporia radiculosa]